MTITRRFATTGTVSSVDELWLPADRLEASFGGSVTRVVIGLTSVLSLSDTAIRSVGTSLVPAAQMPGWSELTVDLVHTAVAASTGDIVLTGYVDGVALPGGTMAVAGAADIVLVPGPGQNAVHVTRLGTWSIADPDRAYTIAASRAGTNALDTLVSATGVLGLLIRKAPGLAAITLGDSITAPVALSGWYERGNQAAEMPLRRRRNAGISGNTTTQMLARLQADVLDHSPEIVTVVAGTNDLLQGATATTVTTNLASIYSQITNAGARVIAGTVPPVTWSGESNLTNLLAVNDWIRDNYDNYSGALLCDWYSSLASDPEAGTPNPSLFSDGVHPNPAGGVVMGGIFATTLADL